MEVKVTNQEFSEDLRNHTSERYKVFEANFENRMKEIYKNVPEYQGVKIRSLRKGSIVVDYFVILMMPFSPSLEDTFQELKDQLTADLVNASQSENGNCSINQDILCFSNDSVKETNSTDLNPMVLCHSLAPAGYRDFYFPLVEEKQLRCVSNCTLGVEGAIDCHQGQCRLEKSGPVCRCFVTETHWYLGPRCEGSIDRRALVGSLAGVGALLLVLVVLLSVPVIRAHRDQVTESWMPNRDMEWQSDATWVSSCVGTFSNQNFEDGTDGDLAHGSFQPALDKVDTSLQIRIQRPEMIPTF
ncbi:mucin-3B-like [Ornithorhynchus anatinus]|uniref:mucin-3B-like n=1 Tax=Ornithorhynchus anatinus TaxID=9258 RepID=UPI0010A9012A|nr:mucin-3B-like [Ornithorhynchus anatinus]